MSGKKENISVMRDREEYTMKPAIQIMSLFLPKVKDFIKMQPHVTPESILYETYLRKILLNLSPWHESS